MRWIQIFGIDLSLVSCTFDHCAWTPRYAYALRATARAGIAYCWKRKLFSVVAEQENKERCSCEERETGESRQSGGNPQRTKVRKRGSLPRNQQEENTVRVGTLAVEVEKMKSELFEAEKSLLQDKELASKLSGSCATQASEWEERQKLQAKRSSEASQWEKSTETRVARRSTERTSATMATIATQE